MAQAFMLDPIKIISTVLIAFIPAIVYIVVVRYSEKFEREPWGSIFQAFLWGGTLGIVLVILIRGFFDYHLQEYYPEVSSDIQRRTLILMCIITPFFAELIKPIGLFLVRGDILEAEDGLIYGAVIGLGYTATENLLYGIFFAPLYGINMFITVVFMRSMSVMFIQSSTTALTCYGITRAMKVKHKTGRFFAFPLFLFSAIGIHALFNYIVFMELFDVGDILFSMSSSLLFSIIFAFILMIFIYVKIYRLDRIDDQKADIPKVDDFGEQLRGEPVPQRRPMPPPRRPPPYPRRAPPDDYYDYEPYDYEPYPPPRPHGRPMHAYPPRGPPPRPRRAPPPAKGFPGIYEPPVRGRVPARAYGPPPRQPPRPPAAPRPPRQIIQTQTPPQTQTQAQPPTAPPRPPRSLTTAAMPPPQPEPEPVTLPEPQPKPVKAPEKAKPRIIKEPPTKPGMKMKPRPGQIKMKTPEPESKEEVEEDEEVEVDWDM
ncbi:PrsW family glutamic-type intramembrane protease [[Eubacterium] cellulosolvens]